MKNLSSHNTIGRKATQKSMATKEWIWKTKVISRNVEKLRMVRIYFAILSSGFAFTKIAFMLNLISSVVC